MNTKKHPKDDPAQKTPEPVNQEVIQEVIKLILKEIKAIWDDERYHYQAANVSINAPLALIQVGLESKMQAYLTVLSRLDEKQYRVWYARIKSERGKRGT